MISIWCDFIERNFLQTTFQELVKQEFIEGATSNPSIFASALKSGNYEKEIAQMRKDLDSHRQPLSQGLQAKTIYENLALQDIQSAAKILLHLYKKNPQNGLVSIEIDPNFCDDIESSVHEGVRLWQRLKCPNAMIKVPATQSGFIIMQRIMSKGINVNATLVFSKEQARRVLQAFNEAYKERAHHTDAVSHDCGHTLCNPQGIISVFVSRFDREMDFVLPDSLRGKYGICNAIDIYEDFQANNENANFRILFASTGVKEKNALYNDMGYYVYPLAFENCVNTLPLATLQEIDYKKLRAINPSDTPIFHSKVFKDIKKHLDSQGLSIETIEQKLLKDGLQSFKQSFKDMLDSLS
ncbi:transaldolase [Helicobacter sp. MIT 14-3879]|uniref:transaldolase n=1 Tax=Helicobacter sp. MIT 14-3879 TaxID=2040649 RepID=UPI000E1F2176|nr:transaldolase [Helicobacter sp. MIT 14-3879]RDU61207.1 transaldolase [Helicobacter sp. MIT 14-3879]